MRPLAIIGYSGHAYVVIDIFQSMDQKVVAYYDQKEVAANPFDLEYMGNEEEQFESLNQQDWFVAIGNNGIRERIYTKLLAKGLHPATQAIHQTAVIAQKVEIKPGVMVGPNATINTFAKIEEGAICNSGCIIEHECHIGPFAHIAPGAVLAGNVRVGEKTFIGANAVVKQGLTIGKNVVVGAGTVVIKDIPDNVTVVGNPQRIIKS